MKTYRHSLALKPTPEQVYKALATSQGHAKLTGSPAKIAPKVGGLISAYDGYITGKNLELAPFSKIVQEWRGEEAGWPPKHFSKVTFALSPIPGGTKLNFTQEGIPESAYEDISQGWQDYYWQPLLKKFGAL